MWWIRSSAAALSCEPRRRSARLEWLKNPNNLASLWLQHADLPRYPGNAAYQAPIPRECQSIVCTEQACCVRSARTEGRKRHHVVRSEESANLPPEPVSHDRPIFTAKPFAAPSIKPNDIR